MASRRVLLRAAKDPFAPVSAASTIERNLIATNVGNLLFSNSAYRLLSTPATEVVTNGPRLNGDPADAARINEEYDAFVVPLANAFRSDFARHLASLTELIERLTIPVTVLGVGAQADLDYDTSSMRPLDEAVSRFMRAVLDRSPSVGVRGELTERYLHELGFRDVEVIGCPSMFLRGDALALRPASTPDASSRIALSVSNWVDGMGSLLDEGLAKHPDTTYFAQELRDLKLLVWGDLSAESGDVAEVPDRLTHPLLRPGRTVFPLDPSTWIDALETFDLAVGNRIHGNIAALLAGTPAMVLCHDSRTLELSRYFEIPHLRADRVDDWAGVLAGFANADYAPVVAGHSERLGRMLSFLEHHGIEHAYGPGGDRGESFDARVRRTTYPPMVDVWDGRDDGATGYRISWLKRADADRATALRDQRRTVRGQGATIARQTKEIETLKTGLHEAERRAATLESALGALGSHVTQLEAAVQRPGPVTRVVRGGLRRLRRAARALSPRREG